MALHEVQITRSASKFGVNGIICVATEHKENVPFGFLDFQLRGSLDESFNVLVLVGPLWT